MAADNMDTVTATVAAPRADTAKPETQIAESAQLAESATTAAVEDAIEAVLAANKLDLDIRFVGTTSAQIADGR
jgi:hypothetical protein